MIARDATSFGGPTASTSITFAHVCAGGKRVLFVEALAINASGVNITGVTYNGVAMTALAAQDGYSDSPQIAMRPFYLLNPALGSNNIVISADSGAAHLAAVAASYSGMDDVDVANALGKRQAAGAFHESITPTVDKSWAIMMAATRSSGPLTVQDSAVQNIGHQFTVTGTSWYAYIYDTNGPVTPAGSVTLGFDWSGSPQGQIWQLVDFAPSFAIPQIMLH